MKKVDIIARAGRSLLQAKTRTILTSLAIAVGAFTLTLSLAAGEGSRQYADKLITSNIDPQTLIIVKDKALFGDGGFNIGGGLKQYSSNTTQYAGATFKSLNAKDLKKIKQTKNIQDVVPSYLVNAQYVRFEAKPQKYTTDITVYDKNVRAEAAAGNLPKLGSQIGDDEIVVPESYVETIGHQKLRDFIGKKVTLHLVKPQKVLSEDDINRIVATQGPAGLTKFAKVKTRDVTFKVRAVSKKSATSLSASQALFISENQAKKLSDFLAKGTDNFQQYITVIAKVKPSVKPETTKKKLVKAGFVARTAKDLQGLLFSIVNILQAIVIGFGMVALIASVFGIINTQYISVLERT